jgi:hypothetical protein
LEIGTDSIISRKSAVDWKDGESGPVTAVSRVLTEFLPLSMTNAMSFYGILLTAEVALRNASGENPW